MICLRPYQRQACDAMKSHHHGQIIMPTGSGKTICMVHDCIDRFASLGDTPGKHIVVAPRILLAQQLCEEFLEHEVNAAVLHVHSGQINSMSSTNANYIRRWSDQHIVIKSFLQPITRLRNFSRQVFMQTQSTLMKHTIALRETFSLARSTLLLIIATAVISSLLLLPTLMLLTYLA